MGGVGRGVGGCAGGADDVALSGWGTEWRTRSGLIRRRCGCLDCACNYGS